MVDGEREEEPILGGGEGSGRLCAEGRASIFVGSEMPTKLSLPEGVSGSLNRDWQYDSCDWPP